MSAIEGRRKEGTPFYCTCFEEKDSNGARERGKGKGPKDGKNNNKEIFTTGGDGPEKFHLRSKRIGSRSGGVKKELSKSSGGQGTQKKKITFFLPEKGQ